MTKQLSYDDIATATRDELIEEIAAAGGDTSDCDTASEWDLRIRAVCEMSTRDENGKTWCEGCMSVVIPEADRVGCGCHCPECDATL